MRQIEVERRVRKLLGKDADGLYELDSFVYTSNAEPIYVADFAAMLRDVFPYFDARDAKIVIEMDGSGAVITSDGWNPDNRTHLEWNRLDDAAFEICKYIVESTKWAEKTQ